MDILQPDAWALLIASWINLILYAVEFLLCIYYFMESSQRKTKWVMIALLAIDTLCTAMVCCNAYFPLIVYRDPFSYEPYLDWTMPIMVTTTFISAMLEQGYFTYRYWSISRNRIITLFLATLIIGLSVFSLVSSVLLSTMKGNGQNLGPKAIMTSGSLASFTDITLAAVTVWKLRTIKTVYDTTRNLVRRVSTYSIVYGATTAIDTLLMLTMYFVSYNAYFILFFCLGRVYSLTVFLNLILLREWRSVESNENSAILSLQSSPLNQIDFGNLGPGRLSREHRTMVVEPFKRPKPAPSFSMDAI